MTDNVLKTIKASMSAIGINYAFGEYNAVPAYPYFVGDYTEAASVNEDGMQEATFFLNGFTRSTWSSLESAKASIESYFTHEGKAFMQTNGSCVWISYDSAQIIQQEDAEIKRIQINLSIKEWGV